MACVIEAMMMPFQKFPEFDEMHFKEVFRIGQLCGMYGMYVTYVWLYISVQSEESKKSRLWVSLSCCHVF